MRKLTVVILLLVLLPLISLAQETASQEETQATIAKIEAEIARLETRIKQVREEEEINRLWELIQSHKARLEKLKESLPETAEPAVKEVVPTSPQEVIVQPKAVPELKTEEPEKAWRFNFDLGCLAGLFGSSTGVFGEVRFGLPFVVGPAKTSFRLAGGYAQSEDMARRFAPLQFDGIMNFPAGWFSGVENYLGAGVNYVVLTTGQKSGSVGGQVFYGVESRGFGGKLFGEVGYGVLSTGFGPSYQGVSAMVGYRLSWGF